MAGRSSVLQRSQFGLEITPGTAVAATKRMPNLMVAAYPAYQTKEYRGQGFKAASSLVMNKTWSEFEYSGAASYDELPYLLASLFGVTTPSTSGGVSTWQFNSAYDAADTPATYTIQHGDATRAGQLAYGLPTDFTLKLTREAVEVSGKGIGQKWTANHALTVSPTLVKDVPITANQAGISIDTSFGAIGTTTLTSAYEVEFGITNRFAPDWVINPGLSSFKDHVELPYTFSLKLTLANDATSDALITQVLAGTTQYMMIGAQGANIPATSTPYATLFYLPFQVKSGGKVKDLAGVYVCDWELEPVIDATAGYAMSATVVNDLAAL